MKFVQTIRSFGIGWLVALVVLILCIGCWFFGHHLTPNEMLGFIASLAIAILL